MLCSQMSHRFVTLGYLIGSAMAIQSSVSLSGGYPVNDPQYKNQAPYLNAINVPKAWERLNSTTLERTEVTVALVDTGVKADHPDLVGNIVTGYNVIRDNTDTDDKVGHGTGMAGVLGATINNSIGIAGVTDLVHIMPISLEEQVSGKVRAAAIDYAIRNRKSRKIKIILMAFSGNTPSPEESEKVKEAVQEGILVVVTVGNYCKNVTIEKRYPCALTEQLNGMLCVAGTETSEMRLGSFSNFANYVDIAAPGARIATTNANRAYSRFTGTSPAAAIIAGVAAMLYSLAPHLTPADVENILKQTSRKGLEDPESKTTLPFGRVDAGEAVAKLTPI